MAIYKKQTVIEYFPAYRVFKRDEQNGAINITVDDILGVKHPKGFYRTYQPGSVVSYALEYNECPIAAYNDAAAKGEKLYWLNARAACLTSVARDQEDIVAVDIGQKVRFEGKLFEIVAAPNDNLEFKEV